MNGETEKKTFLVRLKSKDLVLTLLTIVSLLIIMRVAMYARASSLGARTVLDYDPWWWYRHAETLIENNLVMPKWDSLSHFPPGRPTEAFHGWSYTLAIMYKIANPILGSTLTDVAKWSTLIFAAAAVIPAFLLGRKISNNFGGIATALFGVLTPALIGVSMGGYTDTDMAVVFYTFLSVYSILMAMQKKLSMKSMPYYAFAIIVNLIFVYTWGFGWIIQLFFTGFIFTIFIFRAIEQMIHSRSLEINIPELKKESAIIMPLIFIIFVTNVFGTILGLGNIIGTSALGIPFIQGEGDNIVNISVAELQLLDIFTEAGFRSIVGRVGMAPAIFTLGISKLPIISSPLLLFMLFKLYKRINISREEIFLLMWAGITFLLITRGVRFSLLFATAAAATAGYIIGNIPKYLKHNFVKTTFYGFVVMLMLIFISDAITIGYATGQGMTISGNWYDMLDWLKENAADDSLIVTWWDPGHIIAGYTGLAVHADGAHCGPGENGCIIYSHNDRIQDMGRIFSISDEREAIDILEKYKEITDVDCQRLIDEYGDDFPTENCDEISEMYVLASSDLIQKSYWLNYFGTGEGRNFMQFQLSNYDQSQGVLTYGNGELSVAYRDNNFVPILNFPNQGIRNVVVRDVVYFDDTGREIHGTVNDTQTIEGTVWVAPGYNTAIFMDEVMEDSIFTKMFFYNGRDLARFRLVYGNPEIKVFKVLF